MKSGGILALLSGIITLLGTYVIAIYGITGIVGSGIGFILNLGDLFANAETIATALAAPVWWYFIYLIGFIVFLASGALQIVGMKNRFVSLVFSLFPLAVGLMFFFIAYTDILGIKSLFFAFVFAGEQYGNIFPFLVPLGDLALGTYILIAGGVLGIVSVFLPRD